MLTTAQHLIHEILAKDERENRQIAQLAQLVIAIADAMWELGCELCRAAVIRKHPSGERSMGVR